MEESKIIQFPRAEPANWLQKIPPGILAYVRTQQDVTFHVLYDAQTGEFHGIVRADKRALHHLA